MSRLDPTAVSEPVKVRRLEILTDPGGRRRWSAEEKASIVAEATALGAVVSQVAQPVAWELRLPSIWGQHSSSNWA